MTRACNASRDAILRSGIQILHERGLSAVVGAVRLRDAAGEAYLTTGAAYNIWGNQGEFHRDLAVAAVLWRDAGPLDETLQMVGDAVRSGAHWQEIVRLGAEANLHDPGRDTGYLISLAVRACGYEDAAIQSAAARRQTAGIGDFAVFVEQLMHLHGRRIREPYTVVDLTTALNALSEGFTVQMLSGLDHPRYQIDGKPWTLFGAASVGLIDHFTELDAGGTAAADTAP